MISVSKSQNKSSNLAKDTNLPKTENKDVTKKVIVKKSIPTKKAVIKTKEFGSNNGDFFSGLGFQAPKKVVEKKMKDEPQDELLTHAATKTQKTTESAPVVLSGDNATVIRKAAPVSRPNTRRGYQGSNPRPQGQPGAVRTGYQGSNPRPQGQPGAVRTGYQGSNPRPQGQPGAVRTGYQGSNPRPGYSQNSQNRVGSSVSFQKGKYNPRPTTATTPTPPVAPKRKKIALTSSTLIKKEAIEMGNSITVKEYSEKMGISLQELMTVMLHNNIMGGINTSLDFDTASLIADEFGIKVHAKEAGVTVENVLTGDLQAILDLDKDATNLVDRPPVVTVMGHVDHGKTSLLDYLRKSNITGGEAGGITQSIGASSIQHGKKKITFIDTPGHELFTALRARGAKLTNIAIIIIAADDGIKPQTVESINHAKDSGVPIIVAVTKIDKPNNNFEKIRTDIGNYGLIPEQWGGDVPVVGVSSVTGAGMQDLLDTILLQAEMLELKYNPDRKAVGVVLDAHKDPRQGITTSLIILTGTLKVGDIIVVHNTYGKVKRMLDSKGKPMKKAVGGDPVMILGLNNVPEPGRVIEAVNNEKEAKDRIAIIQDQLSKDSTQSTMQNFLKQMKNEDKAELKLILKADGPSSLEALNHAIDGIALPPSVTIKKIHADIGDCTDSDITLAQAAGAVVVGFNTKTHQNIKKKAEILKVSVKNFNIIYELVATIEQLVNGLIEIEYEEATIGKLNVLAVFFKKEKMMVIGGKVIEGKAKNGADFRILRGEEEIGKGKVTSLQKEQESVKEINEGHECGMKITSGKRIEEGDILEFYIMQEKKA